MNVYKWQTACADPEFTLEDDVGIDDSPDTSMEMEMEGQMYNTPNKQLEQIVESHIDSNKRHHTDTQQEMGIEGITIRINQGIEPP